MIWWNLWRISKAAKVAVILSLLPVLLCKSQELIILWLKSTKQDTWRYVSQVLRHDMRCLCGGCVPGSQRGPWTVCMVESLDGREPETIRNAMFFLYWQKVIKLRCINYMMFIWIMYIVMLLSLLYDYYIILPVCFTSLISYDLRLNMIVCICILPHQSNHPGLHFGQVRWWGRWVVCITSINLSVLRFDM